MHRTKLIHSLALAFALGCSACGGATNSASTMPTSLAQASTEQSRLDAAAELVRMTISDSSVETIWRLSLEAMTQANPALVRLRPVLAEFMSRHFTVDELSRRLAPLYAATFSELELRQLIWFYGTDVGTRAIHEMPRLATAGAEVGGRIVQDNLAELERMIADYVVAHPEAGMPSDVGSQ